MKGNGKYLWGKGKGIIRQEREGELFEGEGNYLREKGNYLRGKGRGII